MNEREQPGPASEWRAGKGSDASPGESPRASSPRPPEGQGQEREGQGEVQGLERGPAGEGGKGGGTGHGRLPGGVGQVQGHGQGHGAGHAPEQEQPAPPPVARWRRIASLLVILAGVTLIVIPLLRAQPVALEVVYVYGEAREGLIAARMSYRQNGEEVRQVRFDYRKARAAETQRHRVRLFRGEQTVLVELSYAGEPPPAVRAAGARVESPGVVTLRRPLVVRGAGDVRVFILGE